MLSPLTPEDRATLADILTTFPPLSAEQVATLKPLLALGGGR